jgi:hypothetical protein
VLDQVRTGLKKSLDHTLVDELLAAYSDMKHEFYLGGLRLSEVEGGRFCEAAFRLLEQMAFQQFTPLGKVLDTERLIQRLKDLPAAQAIDAVRLHIPRALRVVYDIRNTRDAAHLADGIDPNIQDATLVMGILDWVLAELIRIHHQVSAQEAYSIIERLVTRKAPAVEDFDGFRKVLRRDLKAGDRILLLLFECGRNGATFTQLEEWAQPQMRPNLRTTMKRLVDEKAYVHAAKGSFFITKTGIAEVEAKGFHRTI